MSRRKKNLRAFKHQHSDDVITIEKAWDAAWEGAQKHYHSKRMQELEGTIGLERIATHRLEAELTTIKEKALAAVNAPYEDVLDMGLRQALMELGELL